MWRLPPKHCTKAALGKLRGECSDRVRIFQELYKRLIQNGDFIEPNLAKVGIEGSNPFARSKILEIQRLSWPWMRHCRFTRLAPRSSWCSARP
jgi:hypothetical protein